MNYNATSDKTPEQHREYLTWLSQRTLAVLNAARGNASALQKAIKEFLLTAVSANLELEEIENVLGVNEPCILDLAELSPEDEEIVVTAFEQLTKQ